MMKRCIAFLMAMVISFSTVGEIYASELGEEADLQIVEPISEEVLLEQQEQQELPTGLLETELIILSPEEVTTEPYEADLNLLQMMQLSNEYYGSWDKYSTNYFYNQLPEDKRQVWDAWEVMCMEYLCTTKDATSYSIGYGTELVEGVFSERAEMVQLARMFKTSNPQYYFLSNRIFTSDYGDGRVLGGFSIYTAFTDGEARKLATADVQSQMATWESAIANYATEEEKALAIHDLICEKVEYNNAIYSEDFNEDVEYTQTAYSVLCLDSTVCAGYAQAFQMMCNGAGIDTISVTSDDHQWNKVRINDSWCNVDCTWSDGNVIDYSWFERSDAFYDADAGAIHHQEEDFWINYLPLCTIDSNPSYYSEPGTLPTITKTTAAPVISIDSDENGYVVTITCATEGADIYYTLDGTEPSPAYTRSYKYTGPFRMDEDCEVRAVAVCDTYWDSSVVDFERYVITYELDGGTNHPDNPGFYVADSGEIVLGQPEKVGYTFVGWFTDVDYTNQITTLTSDISGNITLYAKWQPITFTVVFDGNNVNAIGTMSNQSITYGSGATLIPNAFSVEGYVFTGWNTKADGTGTHYADGAVISSFVTEDGASIVLYAQWESAEYAITYELNGGTNNSANPATYKATEEVVLSNPTKRGYTFAGWYTDSAFSSKVTKIAVGTKGNLVLYAKWTANTFKIAFDKNHSKATGTMAAQSVTYGSSAKLTKNTFKYKGYTFAGWNTKADGSGTTYKDGSAVKSFIAENGTTIKLYAQWKTEKYTITYNLKGGKNNTKNPKNYYVTSTIKLKNPTKTGYKFMGWYTDSKYKNKVTQIKPGSTGNIKLYAKWQANTYTIKYYGNGATSGKTKNTTCNYGKAYNLRANGYKKKGYKFVGWNTKANGKGTSYKNKAKVKSLKSKNGATIKLYAQWKKVK